MAEPLSASPYRFENDLTGRLFCWLIDSEQIDYAALIEEATADRNDREEIVERLKTSLKKAVKASSAWAAECRSPAAGPSGPKRPSKAPKYSLWFRPDPRTSVRFREVACALLVYTGRLSSMSPPPPA